MGQKYLTRQGLEKIKEELKFLKEIKRKEIAERLETSLDFGDLTENAEYHETKEEQGFVEGRIAELEDLMVNAKIMDTETKRGFAQIGSIVLVSSGHEKEKFTLVGSKEANPLEYKISADSPLGKAFINQPKGTEVFVKTPQGIVKYRILEIE
jgi:transcription elongation factor GreA